MPVKVLQLINSFDPGGAELMAKRLALGYDRVHSDLWTICRSMSHEMERAFVADLEAAGVSCRSLGKKPGSRDPRIVKRLIDQIRRECYDVVHLHCDSPSAYGRLAATFGPPTGRMVTIHCHMFRSSIRLERVFSRITDLYVACSSDIVGDLRERCGIPESMFICILNGFGEDRARKVEASREEIRRRYGIGDQEQVALVLGRIHPQKAQLDLLEALTHPGDHVRRLKIWMVGNDRIAPDYTQRVRQSIEEKDLGSRVRMMGIVEDSEVDELMKSADLFLLPSEVEGLSMAILEALAAGMPTVISDLETNREATDDGRVACLVRPHAPAELAATLEQILADPEAMRARAAEAVAFVNEKFSFERVVDEYSSAYEALVALKRDGKRPWTPTEGPGGYPAGVAIRRCSTDGRNCVERTVGSWRETA